MDLPKDSYKELLEGFQKESTKDSKNEVQKNYYKNDLEDFQPKLESSRRNSRNLFMGELQKELLQEFSTELL